MKNKQCSHDGRTIKAWWQSIHQNSRNSENHGGDVYREAQVDNTHEDNNLLQESRGNYATNSDVKVLRQHPKSDMTH